MILRKEWALLLLALVAFGCGKKDSIDDSVGDAVESAVTTAGGVADEQAGSGFAVAPMTRAERLLAELEGTLLPKAWAIMSCSGRAVAASCAVSAPYTRSVSYDCTMGTFGMSGTVTLTYSSSACNLASANDSVTRTYDMTVTGPRGGSLRRFTTVHTDYRGNSISGGGRITKTASGYTLEVLGNNRVLSANGNSLFDISVRTTSPINVTGGLLRAGRVMDGGAVEVIHNKAQFTATWIPSQVTWTAGCCYPTSGTASLELSGSQTGTASVTFTGCGTATVTKGDTTKDITLANCE